MSIVGKEKLHVDGKGKEKLHVDRKGKEKLIVHLVGIENENQAKLEGKGKDMLVHLEEKWFEANMEPRRRSGAR